jgi:hypothetical protein
MSDELSDERSEYGDSENGDADAVRTEIGKSD